MELNLGSSDFINFDTVQQIGSVNMDTGAVEILSGLLGGGSLNDWHITLPSLLG